MNYNNDFKYDLKVGQTKEQELGDIFNNKTVEVKYDLQALITGNVFVEYFSRGKKSGISTSIADYYCFCFGCCKVVRTIFESKHFVIRGPCSHNFHF